MTIKIEKSGGKARFKANDQEFLVADDGNVGIGTDNPATKLQVQGDTVSPSGTLLVNTPASGTGLRGVFFRSDFDVSTAASAELLNVNNSASSIFRVFANGNANLSGALIENSDAKLKKNVTEATPKLDDISAIRFVNYELKEGPQKDQKRFGVIAQELEEIFPALVETTPDLDEEGNETGTVTKSVKYSVLTLMAVKALQEANDKITALEERLAALEAGN